MAGTKKGAPKVPTLSISNPGKGLNNLISDTLVQDQESPSLNNIMFIESGTPSKRYGYTQVGNTISASHKIVGMASLYLSDGTKQVLAMCNQHLYQLVSSTWTQVGSTSWTIDLTTNFVQARNALYVHNGTDSMMKYDGTTITTPANGKVASFGIYYNGQQFVAGSSSNPSTIYISNGSGSDPSDFVGGNAAFYDLSKDDGQKITGFAKFQEVLIVFKERSTYQFSFDSTGSPVVKQISASVGAVGHRSIDNVENDVFFLSRIGYYTLGNEPNYFNVIRTNELSARVHTTIDTITAANLPSVSSIYYQYKFLSSIPSGGTTSNNRTLVYDKRYTAWTIWDTITANCWNEFIDSSNVQHLYFGDDTTGKVWEFGPTGYLDASANGIAAYFYTKNHNMGAAEVYKQFIDVTLVFRQVVGTVTITVIVDGNQIISSASITNTSTGSTGFGTAQFGTRELGQGSGAISSTIVASNTPYRIPLNKKGRTLQIKVENSNANESFTLLQYMITYRAFGHYTFDSSLKLTGGELPSNSGTVLTTESGDYLITE